MARVLVCALPFLVCGGAAAQWSPVLESTSPAYYDGFIVGDVVGDSIPEVIAWRNTALYPPDDTCRVVVLRGADWTPLLVHERTGHFTSAGWGDADGDGANELVVGWRSSDTSWFNEAYLLRFDSTLSLEDSVLLFQEWEMIHPSYIEYAVGPWVTSVLIDSRSSPPVVVSGFEYTYVFVWNTGGGYSTTESRVAQVGSNWDSVFVFGHTPLVGFVPVGGANPTWIAAASHLYCYDDNDPSPGYCWYKHLRCRVEWLGFGAFTLDTQYYASVPAPHYGYGVVPRDARLAAISDSLGMVIAYTSFQYVTYYDTAYIRVHALDSNNAQLWSWQHLLTGIERVDFGDLVAVGPDALGRRFFALVGGTNDTIIALSPSGYQVGIASLLDASYYGTLEAAWSDVDGDGTGELLTLASDGIPSQTRIRRYDLDLEVLDAPDIDEPTIPVSISLSAAPNPFNPTTVFSFDLPAVFLVRLDVFDVLGRRVAELLDQPMSAGSHSVIWDANGLPSGMYFARLVAGESTATTKVTLLK